MRITGQYWVYGVIWVVSVHPYKIGNDIFWPGDPNHPYHPIDPISDDPEEVV